MIKTYVGVIVGLLLVFGGVGGMEVDNITLANFSVTVLGLLILAIGAPFYDE